MVARAGIEPATFRFSVVRLSIAPGRGFVPRTGDLGFLGAGRAPSGRLCVTSVSPRVTLPPLCLRPPQRVAQLTHPHLCELHPLPGRYVRRD